jgi:hypothetical protein
MEHSRPSPLPNRVLPTGEIVADPARGELMGNRGCIHDPQSRLGTSRWRTDAWISCVLDWRGRRRDVMPPGRWTALFFLDEATALSAGHRPCGFCRRAEFRAFATAWRAGAGLAQPPRAPEMDARLHAERVERRTRRQRTRSAVLGALPDFTMVRHDGTIALAVEGQLRPWSLCGYGRAIAASSAAAVEVLTPPSIVVALRAGYQPLLHATA